MNKETLINIKAMLKARNVSDELIKINEEEYKTLDEIKIYFIEQITASFLRTLDKILTLNIVIYFKSATYDVLKKTNGELNLQIFHISRFAYDLGSIIPQHKLWKQNSKEGKDYPKILAEDPACKYYDFKKNDLIVVEEDVGPRIFKVI
ncbi:hypothetical protein LDVICp146 [lymphocystis disease virus-China]|uniref:Uncharacterized protein n=2 Tax=Lymphocystis disease virus 2 TaxID=159183 RepID=A0A6F8WZS2_9VIRU|nr:hypothetical protein LDVICp146 [lymphocystis disease virus-China]AAU10991.1 hypothetical protein [lymphocystis disease virus-China]BCB67497.1 hypothetical protein [Lymphocystis disease virus 2]